MPVHERFILAEPPKGARLVEAIALGRRGVVLGRYRPAADPKRAAPSPPQPVQAGPYGPATTLRARGSTFRLLVAPATEGGYCVELTIQSGAGTSGGRACRARADGPLGALGFQEHRVPKPRYAVVYGPVGPGVETVEARFENGATDAIPVKDGSVLYAIPQRHERRGHRLVELVARDRARTLVERRRVSEYR